MQGTRVQSLGEEHPQKKEAATHSLHCSLLENPMDRGAWWATVRGLEKESDTTERLSTQFSSELSTGVSALPSFLPKNTQGSSPLEWTGWISLKSKGLKNLFQHHSSKASILRCSACFTVQLFHPYMTTGKTIALTRWTFVGKVMSLLFNMLSRLVITPSKEQASFNFMAAVTICSDFGAQKKKV